MSDRTFEYLLNAMENAASMPIPAEHDYYGKRKAVLAHEAALRAENAALRAALEMRVRLEDELDRYLELSAKSLSPSEPALTHEERLEQDALAKDRRKREDAAKAAARAALGTPAISATVGERK